MWTDADPSEVKSQQSHETSPWKPRLIKESIDILKDLHVIQLSASKVGLSGVVIVQGQTPTLRRSMIQRPDLIGTPCPDKTPSSVYWPNFDSFTLDCNGGYTKSD